MTLAQIAARELERLNIALEAAGTSAYRENNAWVQFGRRAKPILQELVKFNQDENCRVETRPK